jgi:hypothetical protein
MVLVRVRTMEVFARHNCLLFSRILPGQEYNNVT